MEIRKNVLIKANRSQCLMKYVGIISVISLFYFSSCRPTTPINFTSNPETQAVIICNEGGFYHSFADFALIDTDSTSIWYDFYGSRYTQQMINVDNEVWMHQHKRGYDISSVLRLKESNFRYIARPEFKQVSEIHYFDGVVYSIEGDTIHKRNKNSLEIEEQSVIRTDFRQIKFYEDRAVSVIRDTLVRIINLDRLEIVAELEYDNEVIDIALHEDNLGILIKSDDTYSLELYNLFTGLKKHDVIIDPQIFENQKNEFWRLLIHQDKIVLNGGSNVYISDNLHEIFVSQIVSDPTYNAFYIAINRISGILYVNLSWKYDLIDVSNKNLLYTFEIEDGRSSCDKLFFFD